MPTGPTYYHHASRRSSNIQQRSDILFTPLSPIPASPPSQLDQQQDSSSQPPLSPRSARQPASLSAVNGDGPRRISAVSRPRNTLPGTTNGYTAPSVSVAEGSNGTRGSRDGNSQRETSESMNRGLGESSRQPQPTNNTHLNPRRNSAASNAGPRFNIPQYQAGSGSTNSQPAHLPQAPPPSQVTSSRTSTSPPTTTPAPNPPSNPLPTVHPEAPSLAGLSITAHPPSHHAYQCSDGGQIPIYPPFRFYHTPTNHHATDPPDPPATQKSKRTKQDYRVKPDSLSIWAKLGFYLSGTTPKKMEKYLKQKRKEKKRREKELRAQGDYYRYRNDGEGGLRNTSGEFDGSWVGSGPGNGGAYEYPTVLPDGTHVYGSPVRGGF